MAFLALMQPDESLAVMRTEARVATASAWPES